MTITPTMPMTTPTGTCRSDVRPDPPADGDQVIDERQGQQQRSVENQLQEKGLVHALTRKPFPVILIPVPPIIVPKPTMALSIK